MLASFFAVLLGGALSALLNAVAAADCAIPPWRQYPNTDPSRADADEWLRECRGVTSAEDIGRYGGRYGRNGTESDAAEAAAEHQHMINMAVPVAIFAGIPLLILLAFVLYRAWLRRYKLLAAALVPLAAVARKRRARKDAQRARRQRQDHFRFPEEFGAADADDGASIKTASTGLALLPGDSPRIQREPEPLSWAERRRAHYLALDADMIARRAARRASRTDAQRSRRPPTFLRSRFLSSSRHDAMANARSNSAADNVEMGNMQTRGGATAGAFDLYPSRPLAALGHARPGSADTYGERRSRTRSVDTLPLYAAQAEPALALGTANEDQSEAGVRAGAAQPAQVNVHRQGIPSPPLPSYQRSASPVQSDLRP